MNRGARALLLALALVVTAPVARADFAQIQARGTLRILVSVDENPAWFSTAASPPLGFERDVLEGFARLHKLRLEVVPVLRWEQAIPDLVKGRGDVIAGINDTPSRRQQIDFTLELVPSRHVVVTRRPRPAVRTVDELRQQRVGVVSGTTWAEAVVAAHVPETQTKLLGDVAACLEALRDGRITATVMDVVDFLLQRRADPKLEDGLELGTAASGAWGVRKTDPELRRELDGYLGNLKKTASWGRLVVEYFGDDALRVLGRSGE